MNPPPATLSEPLKAVQRPPEVEALLTALRRRIRLYVWVEGLAMLVVWLGLTFWAGLAADYLPVLLGASEMPLPVRVILLCLIAIVSLVIFYRWVLRRALYRFTQHNMAVLLERRFAQFHESLLTIVELSDQPDHAEPYNVELLEKTRAEALEALPQVRLGLIFNYTPLIRNLTAAILLIISIAVFALVSRDNCARWIDRLYLLSEQTWPRRTHIEVLGFDGGPIKVARGSDYVVRARAEKSLYVPEFCSIHYRTAEGDRDRVPMRRVGPPSQKDGERYQYFAYDGRPFKSVIGNVRFDVVGFDHRVANCQLRVVDSPRIGDVKLNYTPPKYTGLLPQKDKNWTPGAVVPAGSNVVIRFTVNKPLVSIDYHEPQSGRHLSRQVPPQAAARQSFVLKLDDLRENQIIDLLLHDVDGIESEEPFRLTLTARIDEPPQVDVVLDGIGSAITPDARLPIQGTVTDDYGVKRIWYEIVPAEAAAREYPAEKRPGGQVGGALDLQELRRSEGADHLELAPGGKITLTIKAADRYNLTDQPNVGAGNSFELRVLTPSELLRELEVRELALRRRFEQIIEEMYEAQDTLDRIKSWDAASQEEDSRADEPEDDNTRPIDAAERARALRQLRLERTLQHSNRSAMEVLGVAASFNDVCRELVNNRVNTKDREERIQVGICEPLTEAAKTMYPEWERLLKEIQPVLDDPRAGPERVDAALDQSQAIIDRLEKVLDSMLDVEDFNQLIEMVREMVREQEKLNEDTKKQRRKQVMDLLE